MIALDLPIKWTISTGRNLLGKGTMNLAGTERAGNRPAYSPGMREGRHLVSQFVSLPHCMNAQHCILPVSASLWYGK